MTRQEVEAGDENRRILGRGKTQSVFSCHLDTENASLIKVPSHVANRDKNYGLMKDVRVNKKPELIANHFTINVDLCVLSLGLNGCRKRRDRNLSQHLSLVICQCIHKLSMEKGYMWIYTVSKDYVFQLE